MPETITVLNSYPFATVWVMLPVLIGVISFLMGMMALIEDGAAKTAFCMCLMIPAICIWCGVDRRVTPYITRYEVLIDEHVDMVYVADNFLVKSVVNRVLTVDDKERAY